MIIRVLLTILIHSATNCHKIRAIRDKIRISNRKSLANVAFIKNSRCEQMSPFIKKTLPALNH